MPFVVTFLCFWAFNQMIIILCYLVIFFLVMFADSYFALCITGNATCAARVTRMNLTIADCTQEVELPICEGKCETHNRQV